MAKLVLYSDQEIPENSKVDQRLLSLFGPHSPKLGYIPSSSDPKRTFYQHKQSYYEALGLNLSIYFEIDIDFQPGRIEELLSCDAIHLSGGNTYHFLYWLKERKMTGLLREYVENGGILIGTSAGAILMTPDVSVTDVFGDTPFDSERMTDTSALNLVDFAFLPHINTLKSANTIMVNYSSIHQCVVYGCQDGDGIIINGDKVELIGNISDRQ